MDPRAGVDAALQDRYAPNGRCFGCGPANPDGLRLKSRIEGDEVVARWRPAARHEAFAGTVNGGIVSTLVDCHGNWTAVAYLMARDELAEAPSTVTSQLEVRFLRPTPSADELVLRGRVAGADGDRVTVEVTVEVSGRPTAAGRATYVRVGPGHPAYHRWG